MLAKRKKLAASISSQHGGADQMEHEKRSELEEKISELEKKLQSKEIQEKAHVTEISKLEDSLKVAKRKANVYEVELRALQKKHRKATDELEAVEKAMVEIVKDLLRHHIRPRNKQEMEQLIRQGMELGVGPHDHHGRVGPKQMGIFDTDGDWHSVLYRGDTKDEEHASIRKKAEDFMTFWEARVKELDFDASTCVDDGHGNMKYVIKEGNEELNQVRKSYGDLVYEAVCNAHLQVTEWGTGTVVWDYVEDRKANISDVVEHCSLEIKPNW